MVYTVECSIVSSAAVRVPRQGPPILALLGGGGGGGARMCAQNACQKLTPVKPPILTYLLGST